MLPGFDPDVFSSMMTNITHDRGAQIRLPCYSVNQGPVRSEISGLLWVRMLGCKSLGVHSVRSVDLLIKLIDV